MSAPTVTAADQAPAAAASPEHKIPPTAIIKTEKIYLRPFEVSDAEALASASNDPELVKYLRSRFPSPYTLADAHAWIAHCHSQPILTFAIFTVGGEYAGSLGLEPPKGDIIYGGTRELGYVLARKFWGRGIMTEAVREFTRWAFATLPELLRIEAAVFGPNEASRRVLKKAGFVEEGARRLAVVKHGVRMDEHVFGLIRTDLAS
ncbi:acyl-CoA N-acyltransferase [Xylaria cf. heliscus]|nr:acyl-CoA N-acyltransferase [Xylaria cf. heliscus]